MVNSESMDSTSDGKPKEYITQLNSGGGAGISVDTHSPSPVTASSVRLRDMDFDANESAADVTSAECANPMDSLPETAVTRSIDEENFRLTNTVTSQADSEVSSVYCSVPLNKVQDVLCSYSAESPSSSDAKNKKLLARRLLCLYCDRTFVTSNLRQKHVDRCHSIKQARRSSSRFQTKFTTACIFCKKLNNTDHTLNDLFKHLVEKHSNKYFACVACKERFVFKTQLEEHNLENHEQKENTTGEEASTFNGALPSQSYPAEDAAEINTVKTKHKTKIKKYSELNGENLTTNRPNLRMGVRKELRKKKVGVKSTKAGVKRNTRLQTKVTNAQVKSTVRKRTKTRNEKSLESSEKISTSVNPYPTFDAFFRVKKITDHSIDNLKISSLTFDDVFDKAFYTRIKCNIQENLQNHIDGKLFKNEESESRISNFEKNQELNTSPAENFGCDISLNAATPVVSLLSSQLGEDLESQIEYGAKASKKKPPPKKDEVHYKYFTRRKYQASILENKENRDLSKLDMWTQLVVKDRQQTIINDKKTEKEKLEYAKGIEYRTKMQNLELNRVLDRRGPFEDLKEEANKKAALEKYNRLGENVSCEAISDVSCILNDLVERVFDFQESPVKNEEDEKAAEQRKLELSDRDCEIPFYLELRRNSSLIDQPDIDKSDRITLICSSQETENYEESTTPRDKNAIVELSGEWTRTRIYICAACGVKVPNMKYLLDHKSIYHQNVWVQHYEFVGNQSVLYKNLSIPGLGKVGFVEEFPMSKVWRRSDARLCTKCSKLCNTLGELHRHILECGEDWSWMLARKKLKYRPFGAKSRRKRRGLVKRIIHKEKSGDEVREKRKYNVKRYDGPRPKPSDAETIQRMLANLPAKRATRKLISLKDGFPKQIRRKSQKCPNNPTNGRKKVISQQKATVSSLKNQPLKSNNRKKKGLKCNSMILRKSVRNINKVFGSKILDSNSTLLVKRKLKSALQHQRITRARKVLMDEQGAETTNDMPVNSKRGGLISKMRMLTRTVKKTVLKKDENKNDSSDISTSVNSAGASKLSSARNTRNLKKGDSLDDTIQDIIKSMDVSETHSDNKEMTICAKLDKDCDAKAEISKKKSKLMKKESVSTKLVRSLSLRKLRKKNAEAVKLKSKSNPELDIKDREDKSKNGKRKSTLDSFRNKIKKIKLREKSITQIVQVDGSSKISDEILPFLEKININSDDIQDKNEVDNDQNNEEDPLGDSNNHITADIISNDEESVVIELVENDNSDNNDVTAPNHILPEDTQVDEIAETSTNIRNIEENSSTTAEIIQIHSNNHVIPDVTSPIDTFDEPDLCNPIPIEENYLESKEMVKPDTPIDLRSCSSASKCKIKKRSKGLNDCIAMLTSKLQQKSDEDPPIFNTEEVSKGSTVDSCPVPVDEPILEKLEEKEVPKIENRKQQEQNQQKHGSKKEAYVFPQIPFIDYFTQQRLMEMNRKLIDRDHIEKQRQELLSLQARFMVEQQQLLLQQLQKQIPTNHQYGYIPNIPRETNFQINNIMSNGQNDFAQKLLNLNQNDGSLTKFLGNFDRNNRFKEVDVNIEIDIMKYLGNVPDNFVGKSRNKNEGRKRGANKAGSTRRYNNKRKENIEVINDLRQQEIINKIMMGKSVENELNTAFIENEELKQKKVDVFKDNDKVIDLKIKKVDDVPRQSALKPSELQLKKDLPPRGPTVIEVGQMRSIGLGIVNEINQAIDLKVKKDSERERQANLLQQLSKNGVSIALFPCVQNSTDKIFGGGNDEIIDLKMKKKDDLISKINPLKPFVFAPVQNDKLDLHDNEKAMDLKIKERVENNGKDLKISDEQNKVVTASMMTISKQKILESNFHKQVPIKSFEEPLKAFLPNFTGPAQLAHLSTIFSGHCIPVDSKTVKKTEKKKRASKYVRQNIEIIPISLPNQELKLMDGSQVHPNQEVINLKVDKSKNAKEPKIFNEIKSTFSQFGHIDLRLFETLNNTGLDGFKIKTKSNKNSKKTYQTLENMPDKTVNPLLPQNHVIDKSPTKEKKKIILKPPQFIATSLEKFPVIETPILPKVPTIAESLSFSIQEPPISHANGINKSVKKKNGARTKNLESIESKIKSLLLNEREPDIMEEKPVEKLCVPRSSSKNRENKVTDKNVSQEVVKEIFEVNLPVTTKSDTDSEDDIPLANLIKENQKKDDAKVNLRNNEPSLAPLAATQEELIITEPVTNKNLSEKDECLPNRADVSLPILEKPSTLPTSTTESYPTNLENDIVVLTIPTIDITPPILENLENDISEPTLEENIPPPILENDTSETLLENDTIIPISEENVRPILEGNPVLPTLEQATELPVLTENVPLPLLEKEETAPILEQEVPVAVLEKEFAVPLLEKEVVSILENDVAVPILEKEITAPVLIQETAPPCTDIDPPTFAILDTDLILPIPTDETFLPTLENDISPTIFEKDTAPAILEPPLEKEPPAPIVQDESCLLPTLETEISDPNSLVLTNGSIQEENHLDISVPNTVMEVIALQPADINGKTKKVRGRKRISPEEKKERPKKKPVQSRTPKSKGTPLYDETGCDPLNKAARKIKISCQIFQKSSKIVLEKSIVNETPDDEEEEDEETRLRNMTKTIHLPIIIDAPLPDVFIKEELSTEIVQPIVHRTELLKNIKEEIPETEEVESEPIENENFFSPVSDPTPSLTAEDLELEIRRRIKLSNLQLKRENIEDGQAIPACINSDIIYNVDSPEMPYDNEEDEYEHVIGNVIEATRYDAVDQIIIPNVPLVSEVSMVVDGSNPMLTDLDSFYIDESVNLFQNLAHDYQSSKVTASNCGLEMTDVVDSVNSHLNCDEPSGTALLENISENIDTSPATTNSVLNSASNTIEEPVLPYIPKIAHVVNDPKENDIISACPANIVASHDEENTLEMNFDAEHEKEGDLPTETANTAPNLEVLEEHVQLTRESESKSKKTKKKYEIPTTDIIPSYGEFEVNTDQTAGVNKITISRKKLQITNESNEGIGEIDPNKSSIDIYVVKKVKRSHRKSVNSKERKRKKSSGSLKENQNSANSIIQETPIPNQELDGNVSSLSDSFADSFLDNVEFEVQNEEIGRKLKINKKKVKDIPSISTSDSLIAPTVMVTEVVEPFTAETEPTISDECDDINLDILEEPKDYDNLPKDMEIEEFQVDIPIIETQYKPKFDIPITTSVRINSALDEVGIQLLPEESCEIDNREYPQLNPKLIPEQSILKTAVVRMTDFIHEKFQKPFVIDLSKDFNVNKEIETDARNFELEQINSIGEISKVTVFDGSFLNSADFDDLNNSSPVEQNLIPDQISQHEPFIRNTTPNLGIVPIQADNDESKLDEANDLQNIGHARKSKRSKNSKISAKFHQVEDIRIVEDADNALILDLVESNNQLQSTTTELNDETHNSEIPTEIVDNLINPIHSDATIDEFNVECASPFTEKNSKKSSKKGKDVKNSKKASKKSQQLDVSCSSQDLIQVEPTDEPKSSLLSNSITQTNRKPRRSKMAQKNETSTFEMMCDELQALCDAPLELRPLAAGQSKAKGKKTKDFVASDDDLDFLNASSSSFCDNLRSSCDAKIDELLREISFSPKPSKKSKKSKRSTSKNKTNKVTVDSKEVIDTQPEVVEEAIAKTTENLNLELEQSDMTIPVNIVDDEGEPAQVNNAVPLENPTEIIVENVAPIVVPTKSKSKSKSSKKKAAKTKKRSISVDNGESYCDICDKMFARSENLVKHKRTLTHIAKLSELEAKEAEAKAKEREELEVLEEQQEAYKMDINISDILNNSEKHCDQPDLENDIVNKMHVNSPFVLNTNSDTLKLADIINDVLNKPVENEKHTPYSESQLSQTSNSATRSETKRYKSLGERKSFESDLKTTYPFNTVPVTNDTIPKLQNADSILKQQISILENIIETEGPFGFIDDITVSSNKSIEEPLHKSPSELSVMSESKQDDSNQLIFTHNSNIMTTIAQQNIVNEPFIRPTQYEEISNDSSTVRNQFDDQRSRKVLNRDEELFLECCSLLKSSSEVSGYSKRSSKTVHVYNNFEMKQSDEPEWLEKKNFVRKNQDYKHDMFSTSCPNTPLGDGYGDDYSNTNSNTIATDWSTKQREQQHENPVFEDISLDSKGSTTSKQEMVQFKGVEPTFGDFQLFSTDRPKESEVNSECHVNNFVRPTGENTNEKEVDEDFKKKMVSRFGGLMAKAWKNSVQAVKKNKNKKKQDNEVTQTSITDYAIAINTAKCDDLNDSKKMLTKGAMKVFEGLKVSIPTDDLDMKELLNGSHATKKQDEPLVPQAEIPPKEMEPPKEDPKLPKANIKSFGNRLGLKVTKKKYNIAQPKDPSPAPKAGKNEDDAKKGHDVYDFEETQDNTDIFNSKLTNIKEFRNQIAEKKTQLEMNTNKEHSTVEDGEESDSDSRTGVTDSFNFEAQSLSSFSTESSSSLKKSKKKNMTKKKCMIMGRIFKNAFKSKVEEDIRDIPSVDNSKLVEDYVMQLPQKDEKNSKLTEQEMDVLFNKLLDTKPATAVETKSNASTPASVVDDKPVEKTSQPKTPKSKGQPKRKRQRHNSDSTDDEFSLTKNKKRYNKKKQKSDDSTINLEQELKECIGVASRKSQRKCTSGKQNILVEFWSSDDSNFEAFLRETAICKPKVTETPDAIEEEPKIVETTIENDKQEFEESPKDLTDTIKTATPKIETESQQKITNTSNSATVPVAKPEKIANLKQARRKSTCTKHRARNDDVDDRKMKNIKVTAETLAANRRKRAASNTLYYWSSSSEDESQDLIEVKPARDELDEDEDRPMQHGWIVGDSPKKLVTMLAQAKGKKVDPDGVKEQGKKRTTM